MKNYTKSQLAIDAIKKFPECSNRAIAKYLVENYPLLFLDVETARTCIRYVTQAKGSKQAKAGGIKKEKRENRFNGSNPFGLPESIAPKREVFNLPSNCDRILWLSDIHFPNQDNEALTAALKWGSENQINCIVLGGDVMDNTPFSPHEKRNFNLDSVRSWFDMVSEFLDMLKREFNCPIYWLEGNHDLWYERYLIKNAIVLFDDPYFKLEQRLGLSRRGINYCKQNVIVRAGKLDMLHGHTLVRGVFAPVNPARGVFMRAKSSTIIGHVHQNSYHVEKTLNDDIIGCWSVGCLCTLSPEYDPHNTKHSQGFAFIQVKEKGNFTVTLKEIHRGQIL